MGLLNKGNRLTWFSSPSGSFGKPGTTFAKPQFCWPQWRSSGVSPSCTELIHQQSISASTRGKDFLPKSLNMHRRCLAILLPSCLISAHYSHFAAFPHFCHSLSPPTPCGCCCSTLGTALHLIPAHRAEGLPQVHPLPSLPSLPFILQITHSSESWFYSPGFLQMGKVSPNEGETGIFLHQTAITEHSAFWRLEEFLKNNEYTWACAFSWVLKLKESELASSPQGR